MAKTLAEVMTLVQELKTVVVEQLGESGALVAAVNKLIDAQSAGQDLQPLFDELIQARDALVGDNQTVQDALNRLPPDPTPAP